jgi:hypothetical protein
LAVLSRVDLGDCDIGEIFQAARAAIGNLAPCQVEVTLPLRAASSVPTAKAHRRTQPVADTG